MDALFMQGRSVSFEQLEWIGQLIGEHPGWGRFRLSQHIAQQWNWRNAAGQLKDMAARSLLLKLEKRGLLQLPKSQTGGGGSRLVQRSGKRLPLLTQPLIALPFYELLPISLELIEGSAQRQVLRGLLDQYHYLGYQRAVGENVAYLARDRAKRVLACLVFGAAAWKCAPRDRYIGWDPTRRQAHLHGVANNMRLLVLPWIRVKHLASHLLGAVANRICSDWQRKYGHPIYLLETFVERDRFSGGCYQAANWCLLGQTQSRSRNDRDRTLHVPCKDVYVYPLIGSFRDRLQTHAPAAVGQLRSSIPQRSALPPTPSHEQ
jgi:hypothetical protein